jgi:hypothetical protein
MTDLLPRYTAMEERIERDTVQGLVDFWMGFYMWAKPYVLAKGRASQIDMRTAQENGTLGSHSGIDIDSINFKEELGLDNKPEALYQQMQVEIGIRLENTCFRLMWWLWEDNMDEGDWVYIKKTRVFGDKVYYKEQPPGAPNAGAPSPIRFPFRIMDTKLIYEYRIVQHHRFQLYFGLALHWIYTVDYNNLFMTYPEMGYVHASAVSGGTAFQDTLADEEDAISHFPLMSLSLRVEANPVAGLRIAFDIQEMYAYYGNYLDFRAGIYNDIGYGVRLGAGYRVWALTVDAEGIGSEETDFTFRVVFQGIWIGLFFYV